MRTFPNSFVRSDKTSTSNSIKGRSETLSGTVVDLELERQLDLEDERMRELLSKAFAASTRRNYAADWKCFSSWCNEREFTSLPAQPEAVAFYLIWLIDRPATKIVESVARRDGSVIMRQHLRKPLKLSTVRRHVASISAVHRATNFADPTANRLVKDVARGIEVERGSITARKARFDQETLRVALASRSWNRLIDVRDRAIALFAWNSAFGRSEIAALDCEQIRRTGHGLEVARRLNRKGRQRVDHAVTIAAQNEVSLCPVSALDAWLQITGINSGSVFRQVDRHGNLGGRIAGEVVATVAKRFAQAAGLDERQFAAYSLRMRPESSVH